MVRGSDVIPEKRYWVSPRTPRKKHQTWLLKNSGCNLPLFVVGRFHQAQLCLPALPICMEPETLRKLQNLSLEVAETPFFKSGDSFWMLINPYGI